MPNSKLLKIILPLLFIFAIIFALLQRSQDPFTKSFTREPGAQNGQGLDYYYQKSRELSGQDETQSQAVFLAVGDIMLSRSVAQTIKTAGDPLLPFRKLAEVFKAADFSVGNLESPFSGSTRFNLSGSLVFNAPPENIQGLKENNFKVLSLANNHGLDQGIKGLENTINYLAENGIQPVGAGKDLRQAWQPAIVEQDGIKIGFVASSYASVNDNGKTANDYIARVEDAENLKSQIAGLKSRADFVVAIMHAGTEYKRYPDQAQTDFAHSAIDWGADLVIGHHPHWIQTLEKYNGKYIFYSLGNFIFDQEWSRDTKEGLMLKIHISKAKYSNPQAPGAETLDDLQGTRMPAKLDKIELLPVVIENYSTPRLAGPEEAKAILDKIGQTDSTLR